MKSFIAVCVVLLAVAVAADDVLVLTEANFDETVGANDLILVEFYAPWCGHCKKLEPEYAAAATVLKESGIALAKVDATEEEALGSKYGVRGFPTLKVFRGLDSVSDYTGGRDKDAIVSYMTKASLPSLSVLEDKAAAETFLKNAGLVVVGFFDSADSSAYGDFSSLADSMRESAVFGAVVGENHGLIDSATGYLIQKNFRFDDSSVSNAGTLSKGDLKAFIKSNELPVLDAIGAENYKKYLEETDLPLGYLFVTGDADAFLADAAKALSDVGTAGKLNFVYLDAERYAKQGARFSFTDGYPRAGIEAQGTTKGKYVLEGTATVDTVKQFAQDFLDDKLETFMMSEEIPESNDGPVTVLVGKNYDSIVNDATKDVLVEFYAPWCGHCKKLAPIYDEVGEYFKGNDDIIIAKMDATANDATPPQDVSSFPTIKWFPKENKAGLPYAGGREKDDFIKFVEGATGSSGSTGKDEL